MSHSRVGTALIHRLVTEADHGGLWILRASIFTDNRAAIILYRIPHDRRARTRPT